MSENNTKSDSNDVTEIDYMTECLRCKVCANNHDSKNCPVACDCGCGKKDEYCPKNHTVDKIIPPLPKME